MLNPNPSERLARGAPSTVPLFQPLGRVSVGWQMPRQWRGQGHVGISADRSTRRCVSFGIRGY